MLLDRAAGGDAEALQALLLRHRRRLERMVELHLDPRMRARVDPCDVVQDAITEAWQELPAYLRDRPIPFYPWLRTIAWERLVKLHQRHVHAHKRSVLRECPLSLPDHSSRALAGLLARSGTTPSGKLERRERQESIRRALDQLRADDRDLLVLLYLEELSGVEAAAVLRISEGAVRMRHLRALRRLRQLVREEGSGGD
jgi:RNA polymerase sigma-70 factor (ECF subfamily)